MKGKLQNTEKNVHASEGCFLLEHLMNVILNSFTNQEATEIPKMYLATSLLASVQYFFHGSQATTRLLTLKHTAFN